MPNVTKAIRRGASALPFVGWAGDALALGLDMYEGKLPRSFREGVDYALELADPGLAFNFLTYTLPKLTTYDKNGKNKYGYSFKEMDSLLSAMTPTQVLEFATGIGDTKGKVLAKVAQYPEVLNDRSKMNSVFTMSKNKGNDEQNFFSPNWRDVRDYSDNADITKAAPGILAELGIDASQANEQFNPFDKRFTKEEGDRLDKFSKAFTKHIEELPFSETLAPVENFYTNTTKASNEPINPKVDSPSNEIKPTIDAVLAENGKPNLLDMVTIKAKNRTFTPTANLDNGLGSSVIPSTPTSLANVETQEMPDTRRFIDKVNPIAMYATIRSKMRNKNIPKAYDGLKFKSTYNNPFDNTNVGLTDAQYYTMGTTPSSQTLSLNIPAIIAKSKKKIPTTQKPNAEVGTPTVVDGVKGQYVLNKETGKVEFKSNTDLGITDYNTNTGLGDFKSGKFTGKDIASMALGLGPAITATIRGDKLIGNHQPLTSEKVNYPTGVVRDAPIPENYIPYNTPDSPDIQANNMNKQFANATQTEAKRAYNLQTQESRIRQEGEIANRMAQKNITQAQLDSQVNMANFQDTASDKRVGQNMVDEALTTLFAVPSAALNQKSAIGTLKENRAFEHIMKNGTPNQKKQVLEQMMRYI